MLALGLLLALTVDAVAQESGRKVALVIGNSQYAELSRLPNPTNDARDIAAALGGMGFTVMLGTDTDEDGFAQLLDDFGTSAQGADVALFFYAGHGIQLDSENYLIPVDARLDTRLALKRETFPLNDIIDSMAGADVSLIFVDACRSFPIEGTFFATGNERVTRVNGPAPVEARRNSFIGFSASPGQVALDGATTNSPFASAMLEFLPRGGVDVSTMFTEVASRVRDATQGAQVPQSWANLAGPVTLVPGEREQVADNTPSAEERGFLLAREIGTEPAYIAFLARYPGGFYAELAKAELEKLRAGMAPQPLSEPPPEQPLPSAGDARAMHELANQYRDGRGVAKNAQRARELYEGAHALGSAESAYNLAWLLDAGDGIDRDSRQAAQYFMEALAAHQPLLVQYLLRDGRQLSIETRLALQQALKDGGFYSGAVDGAFGPRTNAAIAAAGGQPVTTVAAGAPGAGPDGLYVPPLYTAPQQNVEPGKAALPSCAMATVAVDPLDGNDTWDPYAGSEAPDIIFEETLSGAETYCEDALGCLLMVLDPTSRTLQLRITDEDDYNSDDAIGEGTCDIGRTCRIGQSQVTVKSC